MVFSVASRSLLSAAARQAGASSSAALLARSAPAAVARRTYADAAASDKLKLDFILPHQALYNSSDVTQVNISAASGDMGILASHVPSVEELKPGLVEVVESGNSTKKWFVSGGFATVHPNNKLTINAIEAFPLESFSPEAVRSALTEAQRAASSGSDDAAKAEAEVEVEVYTALQAALGR
ncbi:delta subunit of the central stalk of mitochondrial F1F0 ATP synthase, atp16 [Tilletia horrida]|uniref:ATP synthase subunit delta, mitochondrial n=1 Tax=Tilletia horrida TaxID=155126 RepID=A0AAN6G4M9_9BASI|nr:delta subunit of the central stalk of mitochondrial F1F0 ATP synthase, atp16 [Tilletia horrida]KAK0521814.1 delta subunit of the central stalk of mitochondrial F1F0 ATP synthase, atp16 [Tilletia horrida]KAK0524862.1 delta subunit of the central stalk of mitochondrial F1F0 ATP synthase, atp16 [Tilletia horrida]KAK0546977.1 delta subunit of the central stalk of mitochondrial F1F0 ATP synthase, atp16 [Tilletia horrida]